jgi:hypothetical protein
LSTAQKQALTDPTRRKQTNYNSKNTSLQTVIRLRFDGISENMHGKMNEAVPFKDFDVLNQTLGNLGD